MQGVTKGSKEKKKSSFISHRLEKGNNLLIMISKYSSVIYIGVAIKAFVNDQYGEQIIYGLLSIVQLIILKLILSQKQKASTTDSNLKEKFSDTSIID